MLKTNANSFLPSISILSPNTDNVFLTVGPGQSMVYPYQLPADHAPGTHWYHAHYHGSSTYQIMGGLVGALLVLPLPGAVPASIAEADSFVMVITHIKFDQSVDSRSGRVSQGCGRDQYCDPVVEAPLCTGEETEPAAYQSFRIYSYLELGADVGNDMDVDEEFVDESILDMLLINGQYVPSVALTQGSNAIFRFVSATGGGLLYLSLRQPRACSLQVIAYDGVYLDAALEVEHVALLEGSRADVQVTCHRAGTFALTMGNHTDVLLLVVAPHGHQQPAVTDAELRGIVRPFYLSGLMGADTQVDSYYSVHTWRNGLNHSVCGHWLGSGHNCSQLQPMGAEEPNASSTACPFGQFSGSRGSDPANYTAAHKLVTALNATNEWVIYGMGSDPHPIHVHVHHMQVYQQHTAYRIHYRLYSVHCTVYMA
jgi:FtsP/CotA-like multicopper oxidase with cupredoxin domain